MGYIDNLNAKTGNLETAINSNDDDITGINTAVTAL